MFVGGIIIAGILILAEVELELFIVLKLVPLHPFSLSHLGDPAVIRLLADIKLALFHYFSHIKNTI